MTGDPQLIGWLASAILLATLLHQMRSQWRSRTTEGVSAWLFVGQAAASAGFLIYSALIGDVVFVVTNSILGVTALAGFGLLAIRRRRGAAARRASPTARD